MSASWDVKHVVCNIGALSNALRPLFKVPATGGAITILSAHTISAAAATTDIYLVTAGTAGTTADGTIGTPSLGTLVAATPTAMTLSATACVVQPGKWVCAKEANAGAANAVTIVSVAYIQGI